MSVWEPTSGATSIWSSRRRPTTRRGTRAARTFSVEMRADAATALAMTIADDGSGFDAGGGRRQRSVQHAPPLATARGRLLRCARAPGRGTTDHAGGPAWLAHPPVWVGDRPAGPSVALSDELRSDGSHRPLDGVPDDLLPSMTVVIVEDERDVREGLAILIDGAPGFRACPATARWSRRWHASMPIVRTSC